MYMLGRGVRRDLTDAVSWFKVALVQAVEDGAKRSRRTSVTQTAHRTRVQDAKEHAEGKALATYSHPDD